MGDFIHYTMAGDPEAKERRRLYHARATSTAEKSPPYSPARLSLAILW